jgi:hypothetical protein
MEVSNRSFDDFADHGTRNRMGSRYTDSCKLIHFNFAPSPLPKLSRRGREEYTEREQEVQRRVDDWLENHMGYAIQMRTRPHTIGFGFNDNPVSSQALSALREH